MRRGNLKLVVILSCHYQLSSQKSLLSVDSHGLRQKLICFTFKIKFKQFLDIFIVFSMSSEVNDKQK